MNTLPSAFSLRHQARLAATLCTLALAATASLADVLLTDAPQALSAGLVAGPADATVVVYDSITGAALSFTGSVPRTYMGQGFSVADPGGPVQISSMQLVLVAGAAVNYANSRINVAFWNGYDSTGASGSVFSAPLGINSFTTGPVSTTGAAAFTYTLTFATPVTLTGLTNHGLAVNWQSDAAGTGTFIDDTNLTSALRATGSAAIAAGANVTPSSGYYRNASGSTNFNFPTSDARFLTGVTNGGLAFSLSVTSAVPEASSGAMLLLGLVGMAAFAARQRRSHTAA